MADLGKEGWDPLTGVVRRHGALRYREGIARSDLQFTNLHIRFYAGLNPRQEEGDSLACLCPLSVRNFAALVLSRFSLALPAFETSRTFVATLRVHTREDPSRR